MIKVTIDQQKYAIPTSWKDITVSKWRQMLTHKGELLSSISLVTDIPIEVLENCDMQSVEYLKELTAFIYEPDSLNAYNFYDKKFEAFNVGQQKAKTILAVQGALAKAKKIEPEGVLTWLLAGQEITQIYLSEIQGEPVDISDDSIAQWYGLMCFFLSCSLGFSINTVISMITNHQKTRSKRVSMRSKISRRISAFASRSWRGLANRLNIS